MNLVFHNSTSDKKYNSKFFEKILNTAAKELKLGEIKLSVSVNLVSGTKIKELNRKYRHKNKPTDVLSFPIHPPCDAKRIADKRGSVNCNAILTRINADSYDLGDIFICLSIAKEEAKRENVSIERKLAQLTAHGFLHLAGYDHERSKKEANKMLQLESKILKELNF